MSKSGDGNRRNCIKVDDIESTRFDIQGGISDNVHSSEEDFRGFEKIPIVLCQKLDLTPYLNKIEYPLTQEVNEKMISNGNFNHTNINKLLYTCSVVLVRDDLEKLQEMARNDTPVNGVSCLKCKFCDKMYSSEKKLQNHQENKHMIFYKSRNKMPKRVSFSDHIIVHEVKEYHRCRKCPRIFKEYNALKVHMKQQHKKRKCYICFYCSKDFVDRTFFKVHIKLHCDSCGLLLANKRKYLEHRRYVCRIIKKHECKTCNMSFFKYMDLKDHSYDHLGTFFICDICKDQFETKCEVAHHIKFLHTKKRSNELYIKGVLGIDSVYMCKFCEESSIEEHVIEKHVSILPDLQNRAMTGYKDYYFCDQCLRKFNTETDMLQHKWTHFLKTSDNSQLRKETESNKNVLKITYKVDEKLPDYLQPKLILERVEVPKEAPETLVIPETSDVPMLQRTLFDIHHFDENGMLKKPVVDPVTKKTIISKHRCEKCAKYLSSNYCLTRHMQRVHGISKEMYTDNLQCNVCEEVFVWPSLLQSHNCIRMTIPEMPFDDARPEVHFENLGEYNENGFDDINISDNDDYMNSVDFEIPAPIVQLTEFDHLNIVVNGGNGQLNVIEKTFDKSYNKAYPLNSLSYKVVMQEVPIEF